jgi:hypothetical protein
MKKMILLFAGLFLFAFATFSQNKEGEIELLQQYFGVEKTSLIQDYMKFTPKQDSAFWPVYKEFEKERLSLGKQRIKLVEEYMKNIEKLSDSKATSMVDKSNSIEIAFKNLQKKYFSRMSKAIGPIKAAQWYQFENYLNNVINLSIQESIPFVGELEKMHDSQSK